LSKPGGGVTGLSPSPKKDFKDFDLDLDLDLKIISGFTKTQ
jgi:hypothetical protein